MKILIYLIHFCIVIFPITCGHESSGDPPRHEASDLFNQLFQDFLIWADLETSDSAKTRKDNGAVKDSVSTGLLTRAASVEDMEKLHRQMEKLSVQLDAIQTKPTCLDQVDKRLKALEVSLDMRKHNRDLSSKILTNLQSFNDHLLNVSLLLGRRKIQGLLHDVDWYEKSLRKLNIFLLRLKDDLLLDVKNTVRQMIRSEVHRMQRTFPVYKISNPAQEACEKVVKETGRQKMSSLISSPTSTRHLTPTATISMTSSTTSSLISSATSSLIFSSTSSLISSTTRSLMSSTSKPWTSSTTKSLKASTVGSSISSTIKYLTPSTERFWTLMSRAEPLSTPTERTKSPNLTILTPKTMPNRFSLPVTKSVGNQLVSLISFSTLEAMPSLQPATKGIDSTADVSASTSKVSQFAQASESAVVEEETSVASLSAQASKSVTTISAVDSSLSTSSMLLSSSLASQSLEKRIFFESTRIYPDVEVPYKVWRHWRPWGFLRRWKYHARVYGPEYVAKNSTFDVVCEIRLVGLGEQRFSNLSILLSPNRREVEPTYWTSIIEHKRSSLLKKWYVRVNITGYEDEGRFYCSVDGKLLDYVDTRILNRCEDARACFHLRRKTTCQDPDLTRSCCKSCSRPANYLPSSVYQNLRRISVMKMVKATRDGET